MAEIDIKKLEKLSMLRVPEELRGKIGGQLENIIKFIDQLSEVDTEGVAPMASTVREQSTPERQDKVTAENEREALLANAPAEEHGFFVVPRVVE